MPAAYPHVDAWVDLVAMEHEILALWAKDQTFARLRAQTADGEPWSFLDGPITANNPMGVHHAWGRTLKDLYCRYHAMNGRSLRFQNGFDCQGLWVEVEVEKELGFRTKRDIASYGIDRFVTACKERVLTFAARQTHQSIRLGYWMDWDAPETLLALRDALHAGTPELTITATNGESRTGSPEALVGKLGTREWGGSYFTFSTENNYTIWSFLKKCHQQGHVHRGTDVMPWCCRCGTGLSQMEVAEGRRIVEHTSVFVRFPLRGRDQEALLVWTTTPWTLTSNVAAAVHPDLEYLRVSHLGWVLYVSKTAFETPRHRQLEAGGERLTTKLPSVGQILRGLGDVEVLGRVKGAELVGLAYDGPFDHLPAQRVPGGVSPTGAQGTGTGVECHRVVGWEAVSDAEGTGIVHVAPGCGAEDAALGRTENLVAIAPLDEAGDYLPEFGEFAGRSALTISDEILAILKERGTLVAHERYPHVYPHCWRCKQELVFRLVDEWFIGMDWRARIEALVPQVTWIPSDGEARELDWLRNMGDWMISKKRFWGLALPIWVCGECNAFDVLGSEKELSDRAVEGWEAFAGHAPHRPHVDAVKLRCACGGTMERIPDVGNPWLDAGIVPYSTLGYTSDRASWDRWFPADLVLECFPGQFRNWFYALLAMSAMMEDRAPFRTLLGHGLVRDERGQEMHKSKGNAIWFDDAAEEFGADAMRWVFAGHEPVQNLGFGPGRLREVRGGFLNQLWNVHAFFVNYARTQGYSPNAAVVPFAERPEFDRWILSELQDLVVSCRAAIDVFEHQRAAHAIQQFVETLSNWYLRHNRRRFRADARDMDAAFQTLEDCVETLARLLAPIVPFTAEKLYQNAIASVRADRPGSVHLCTYPQAQDLYSDPRLTAEMRGVVRITTLALAARDVGKLKVRQPLALLQIGPETEVEREGILRFKDMLAEHLNVKSVDVVAPGSPAPLAYLVKPDFKALGPRLGDKMGAVQRDLAARGPEIAALLRGGANSVAVQVGAERIDIGRSDIVLVPQQPAGFAVAEARGAWCAVSTEITRDLHLEGLLRELLRYVQDTRKKLGMQVGDPVALDWDTDDTDLAEALSTGVAVLSERAHVIRATRTPELDADPVDIAGRQLRARLTRI